ncbi:MAG: hypothetical protein CM15mP120_20060 [Pseudomonadota bacterium]|nr:MAG: hypothetical protein CM15mP120_20060 [Pseudomonadota bacterium]
MPRRCWPVVLYRGGGDLRRWLWASGGKFGLLGCQAGCVNAVQTSWGPIGQLATVIRRGVFSHGVLPRGCGRTTRVFLTLVWVSEDPARQRGGGICGVAGGLTQRFCLGSGADRARPVC